MENTAFPPLSQKSSACATPRQSSSSGRPMNFPGVKVRNPIIGNYTSYVKNYSGPALRRSVSMNLGGPRMHERSMFVRTNYGSSYYIIHPDWTSEPAGMQRLRSSEASPPSLSWDRRPAVPPLSGLVERRSRGEFRPADLQAYRGSGGGVEESRKPAVPRYTQGNITARF